jgi:hypothetical protein
VDDRLFAAARTWPRFSSILKSEAKCAPSAAQLPRIAGDRHVGVNQEILMAVEQARVHIVPKPWGSTDLRPWHVRDQAPALETAHLRPETKSVIRTPPAKAAP